VVDELRHTILERPGHGDEVEDREVLNEFAQPDATCVGTYRHAELRGEEVDRNDLVSLPNRAESSWR
jgi:hypothetical protein